MVNVKLHGIFENYMKLDWNFNISTVAEAFEAIEANTNCLIKTLGLLEEYISNFIVYVDGKIMPPEYINSPILKNNSKIEVVQFLITKLLTPKSPIDIKTTSKIFSSYENVTKRNVPIPIGYGRLKIGSVVISNDVTNINEIAE